MPPQINQSMTPLQWAALLALGVLWGGSFFFIGVAIKELPPITLVTVRLNLAAILLYAFARARGVDMPRGRAWLGFAWLGVLNNVIPFCLFAWSQTHITGGLASILNATTPLFTVVVAHVLTRDENMTPGHIAGAAIGLLGVAAMIGSEFDSVFSGNVLAQLACLVASLSYAFAAVYGRRFAGVPPLAAATAQLTTASIILVPIMLATDRPWALAMPSNGVLAAMAVLVVFCSGVAYVLYFHILATAGATNVGLVTFLNPITAIILGAVFLGEQLQPAHIAGMAVIGIGLAFIDGRPLRALKSRSPTSQSR